MNLNLTSANQVKALLAEHGLRPKRRLGQNFLIDRNIVDKLVEASGAAPDANLLEIGPGLGVVTREIAPLSAKVVCVEIDHHLEAVLKDVLSENENVEIVIEDFLKLNIPEFLAARGGGKWAVVGNLPYYITTPIIAKLLGCREYISSILMMVQKEVAQRLAADPATPDYGSLSVFVQFYCEVESVMRVSRNVFKPVPDVDSEIVKLTVRKSPKVDVKDEALFFKIVRAAFGKRRKTLLNALGSSTELGWDKTKASAVLSAAGIDPVRRGETLSIEEFATLANIA